MARSSIDGLQPEPPLTARFFHGRHCILEEISAQHIKDLYPRPDVVAALAAYRPWYTPMEHTLESVIERRNWVANLSPRPEIEALILTSQALRPVGFICLAGIDHVNSKAELTIAMFQGRGTRVMLEALHWVLETAFSNFLHKLVFCVSPDNAAALRLMKGLGIPLEAVLKDEILTRQGTRQDLCRYALLAPDWHQGLLRQRFQRWAPLAQPTPPQHSL